MRERDVALRRFCNIPVFVGKFFEWYELIDNVSLLEVGVMIIGVWMLGI